MNKKTATAVITALKEALAYIEDVIVSDSDVDRRPEKRLAKKIRAAISKAEGRSA